MNILMKGFFCEANIAYEAETAIDRQIAAQPLWASPFQTERPAKATMD